MNNDLFGLSEKELNQYINQLDGLINAIEGGELDKYLKDKGNDALDNIMAEQDINSDARAGEYEAGNEVKIAKDYIKFYNDSEIDIGSADTWFNDYGKEFYPPTLSLSELIEYGTGLVGYQNSKGVQDEWSYMLNPSRDYTKGWEWNNNGKAEHTEGQAGKYIYYELSEKIKENLDNWVQEFIRKRLGGNE